MLMLGKLILGNAWEMKLMNGFMGIISYTKDL